MSDTTSASDVIGSAPAAAGAAKRFRLKRAALVVGALAGLAVAADYGVDYWKIGRFLVETDDAYVDADSSTIAPKVSGYIAKVLVDDNQIVKAGTVLATIDDRDLQTALAEATAARRTAEMQITNIDAQLHRQQSVIEQAQAHQASVKAALVYANQERARFGELARTGAGTVQMAQQTSSLQLQREADVADAEATLAAAKEQLDVLNTERGIADAKAQQAGAVEHQAELNLSYATITAPIDGSVGARSVRVGKYVQAGTQLMAIVPNQQAYIVANYKETQLTHVAPGQPVEITVDTYSGETIRGHVDSLSPASGLQFALLPADNATGNFTKIVQRIPVKITIDQGQSLAGVLRPGMSVEPSINTKPAR
ncbi:MAG TPA: HlyD family secretion protein [Aliidongia sp.]|nr:HlyD family secretion protein [Aliidongia sp.]